ncbi:HAD hydrolase-like protein [Candidatus Woesearchaeota archaeon]|nr:HAD hydrolase-like protein [Candidatus Woesearchaeota archaeon]
MLKLLIFDLDNTLFDTYGQLGVNVLEEMINRMKKAGLKHEQEKVIRDKYMQMGFRSLAKQLGLSEKIKSIGMDTYKSMDLSNISPFDDVNLIKEFKQKKILVTSGTEQVQNEKIRILGIAGLFDEIVVDVLGNCESRVGIFCNILNEYKLKSKEVMVLGDNAEVEIAAGKKLRMITVQILRRPFVKGKADYYVKGLEEVKEIIKGIK